MWSNYHTHTDFCDGSESIANIIARARDLNIVSLGLSSHAPLPFEKKWCMKAPHLENYIAELRSARLDEQNMELYCGLEADYIPDRVSPSTFRKKLDYVIGSIHFVDEFADGRGWEIDGPYADFLVGFRAIFKGNMRAAVQRYFELTRQMVTRSTPDIVGHLDKIKMQNKEQSTFDEPESWYRDTVRETLTTIRDAGCIVEVNTRGLYQKKTTTTYPSPWIIEEIGKMNIPVTLSSDAHHPDDLVNRFPEAAGILRQAGIKKIRILSGGKWRDAAFDEHGIKDYQVAH
jgi:histidinol-phosphatase (PHP family)